MSDNANPTWPRRWPLYRFTGLVVALSCGFLLARWQIRSSGPLERFYLPQYVKSELVGDKFDFNFSGKPKPFAVVFAGPYVATNQTAAVRGARLSVRILPLAPHAFRAWLRTSIYGGASLATWLRWPLTGTGFLLVLFIAAGGRTDRSRNQQARDGKLLRGPRIVTRWQFNRAVNGDGLALLTTNRRTLFEWLKGRHGFQIRVPLAKEAHHIQIQGGTGAGKSTVIRQYLHQIRERGECAIVFDPDCEYVAEFHREGDTVLNPLDNRVPYWAIEEEAETAAEAVPIAEALWPDEPNQQPFFKKQTRGIFAHLIGEYNRPKCPDDPATCEALARWLAFPQIEVARRIAGTRFAVSTDPKAKDQSQGLWATLGEVATPLEMMPGAAERRPKFTVREWVRSRPGWIFITSTPDTLAAVRPLQTAWLDMLILGLMTVGKDATLARVWLVLDEVASLRALPNLVEALTRQRKSDNPIILGFQGMGQLDFTYGTSKAEVIASQAYTNIIMRTGEQRAAEHSAGIIGKAEIERITESKPAHSFVGRSRSRNYSTQRVIEPAVLASEIQELPDLTAYFVQQGWTAKIRIAPTPKVVQAPKLIERRMPERHMDAPEPEAPPVERSKRKRPRGRVVPMRGYRRPHVPLADEEPASAEMFNDDA